MYVYDAYEFSFDWSNYITEFLCIALNPVSPLPDLTATMTDKVYI